MASFGIEDLIGIENNHFEGMLKEEKEENITNVEVGDGFLNKK